LKTGLKNQLFSGQRPFPGRPPDGHAANANSAQHGCGSTTAAAGSAAPSTKPTGRRGRSDAAADDPPVALQQPVPAAGHVAPAAAAAAAAGLLPAAPVAPRHRPLAGRLHAPAPARRGRGRRGAFGWRRRPHQVYVSECFKICPGKFCVFLSGNTYIFDVTSSLFFTRFYICTLLTDLVIINSTYVILSLLVN